MSACAKLGNGATVTFPENDENTPIETKAFLHSTKSGTQPENGTLCTYDNRTYTTELCKTSTVSDGVWKCQLSLPVDATPIPL